MYDGYLIPKQIPGDKGKKTLVLDLDETLVRSTFTVGPYVDITLKLDGDPGSICVYAMKRPGLDDLITQLAPLYEIIIFTASQSKYAEKLIEILDPNKKVRHRLYREHCSEHQQILVKDLTKLNRNINQCIIVDNSPLSYFLQPENAIPIESWFGDKNDTELFKLAKFLKDIAISEDVVQTLASFKNNPLSFYEPDVKPKRKAKSRNEGTMTTIQPKLQELDGERGEEGINSPIYSGRSILTGVNIK